MSDVFISYARSNRPKAEALARLLSQQNWSVWWDRDIDFGKPFDEVIEEELTKARCVLVLWSVESVRSHWVRSEARLAMEQHTLLPIQVDQRVVIPLEFRNVQTVNLSGWHNDKPAEVARLLRQVSQTLGRPMSGIMSLDLREDWKSVAIETDWDKAWFRVELSWETHDVTLKFFYKVTRLRGTTSTDFNRCFYSVSIDGIEIDTRELPSSFRRHVHTLSFPLSLTDGGEVRSGVLNVSFECKGQSDQVAMFYMYRIFRGTVSCELSVEGRTLRTQKLGESKQAHRRDSQRVYR